MLPGDLGLPVRPRGLVIFVDGAGGTRVDPRSRHVADVLGRHDWATLLIDLLTEEEEPVDARTGRLRFDMALLAERIIAMATWAQRVPQLRGLAVALFGTDTGAGAALVAAARQPRVFRAVISQSGRPDLAGSALGRMMAPTLFLVGAQDEATIELTQRAIEQMHNNVRLEIVEGATRLFEDAGAIAQVARLSADWLTEQLR